MNKLLIHILFSMVLSTSCLLFCKLYLVSCLFVQEPRIESTFSIPYVLAPDSWSSSPGYVIDGRAMERWGTIRITPRFVRHNDSTYSPSMNATNEEWDSIGKVMDWLINEIRLIVQVRQLKGPVRIPRLCKRIEDLIVEKRLQIPFRSTYCNKTSGDKCTDTGYCYNMPVPLEHSDGCYYKDENHRQEHAPGSGIPNTDLMLYVTIANCPNAGVAYATPCQFERKYGTPVAGLVAICSGALKDPTINIGKFRAVLFHELLHVLLFKITGHFYVDRKGTKQRNTVKVVNRTWQSMKGTFQKEVVLSTLPSVLEFGRRHFECPSFDGVELYNETTQVNKHLPLWARFGGHYTKRLYTDALLSPVYTYGSRISELEAAFLNDTGWYKINHSYPFSKLESTKGKGCLYVQASCYEYAKSVNDDPVQIYPYCNYESRTWSCSPDRKHAVECFGQVAPPGTPVSDIHYYNDKNFLGFVPFSGCPFFVPSAACTSDDSFYGKQNKVCMDTPDYHVSNGIVYDQSDACYEVTCQRDKLIIQNGQSSKGVICNEPGQFIPDQTRNVTCPKTLSFCDNVKFVS